MAGLPAYRFPKFPRLPLSGYSMPSHYIRYRNWSPVPSLRLSFSTYVIRPRELYEALQMGQSSIGLVPRVLPLCAAWFPANDPGHRTGIQVFHEKRIPKARFFDINKAISGHSLHPHMLPGAVEFAASMGELGIRKEDILVVYDSLELDTLLAPRVGWMLKAFGHPNVHILNNFSLWVEQGLPTEQGEIQDFEHYSYPVPRLGEAKLASFEDVREAIMEYKKD